MIRGAVPAALCEGLVLAIGEVSGLDADRPETWYRDPLLASDIVPMCGHHAQWDIRQHSRLLTIWSALWDASALLVTLDRCRFTPPWRDGQYPTLSLHWDPNPHGREPPVGLGRGRAAGLPGRRAAFAAPSIGLLD